MATFSKELLSSSPSSTGRGIKIASSSTDIHTANVANTVDEVWLYAVNTSTSSVKLTVYWGASNATDDEIEITINGESGLTLVIPGLILKGATSSSPTVKALAGTTNVIVVHGYVNRITA